MSFDASRIEQVRTIVFSENLAVAGLASATTKCWTSNACVQLGFRPDFAIVRTLAYSCAVVANAGVNVDTQLFVLTSDLSGTGNTFMGCFGAFGTGAAASTSVWGSNSCPQTLIKCEKPVTLVRFQVLTPSATVDDKLVFPATTVAGAVNAIAPYGNLMCTVDFIKLTT